MCYAHSRFCLVLMHKYIYKKTVFGETEYKRGIKSSPSLTLAVYSLVFCYAHMGLKKTPAVIGISSFSLSCSELSHRGLHLRCTSVHRHSY